MPVAFSLGSDTEDFRTGPLWNVLGGNSGWSQWEQDVLFFKCQHLLTTILRAIRSFHTVPCHLLSRLITQMQFQASYLMAVLLQRKILSCSLNAAGAATPLCDGKALCLCLLLLWDGFWKGGGILNHSGQWGLAFSRVSANLQFCMILTGWEEMQEVAILVFRLACWQPYHTVDARCDLNKNISFLCTCAAGGPHPEHLYLCPWDFGPKFSALHLDSVCFIWKCWRWVPAWYHL